MPLILEGLVTTRSATGDVNIAPMGPIVDREITRLTLRPFRTSTTYANLKQSGVGVFHVTDDVELLARAALGQITSQPPLRAVADLLASVESRAVGRSPDLAVGRSPDRPTPPTEGLPALSPTAASGATGSASAELPLTVAPASLANAPVLTNACRWYAFVVDSLDHRDERTQIECRVAVAGRLRDFFGWNRAAHAVVEAAILATRTAFLSAEQIRAEMARLTPLIEKTAGPEESRAFAFLQEFIEASYSK